VPKQAEPRSIFRLLVNLTTGFNFAIALRLSNLSDPVRVISFLLLPFDSAFDPSLAYLAVGTLPLASLLYHFGRSKEQPRLGGQWAVPKGGKIDSKLVLGAAIFGVGWGLVGICRELLALFSSTGILTVSGWHYSGTRSCQPRKSTWKWFGNSTNRCLGGIRRSWRSSCMTLDIIFILSFGVGLKLFNSV
jgi:uncharacterized membrane protein YedE/YeeE